MAYSTATTKDTWEIKQCVKPTNTGTDQTTGDSSPCHIYPKHHKIHCPSK